MLTEMIKHNYRHLKINRFYMSILLIGLGLVFKFFEKNCFSFGVFVQINHSLYVTGQNAN